MTRANTVNPPFCASKFAELSARFTNHWLDALFGSPPSFAIATVPRRFEMPGSFWIVANVGTDSSPSVVVHRNPPPCTMNPATERCMKLFAYRPASTYAKKFATEIGFVASKSATSIVFTVAPMRKLTRTALPVTSGSRNSAPSSTVCAVPPRRSAGDTACWRISGGTFAAFANAETKTRMR